MGHFVPYELAVKLEQKGFKQGYNIFGFRPIFSDETTIRFISDIGAYEKEYFGENISAPTISQVLKWLREEKEIHIQVLFACPPNRWEYVTIRTTNCEIRGMQASFISYEQAALAGIEYVIDNLI